jgi:ABC-2 type transport system permease protein
LTRPFLWWIARTTANRVRRQVRRLRNPRYLLALLFAVLYFWFLFGDWLGGAETGTGASAKRLEAAELVAPLGLALVAAWWWLWGGYRRAILLSPAETNLLLPAPLTRRALVRFKILQAQVPMLFSALLFTLITRSAPLPFPLRFASLWLMFATLHLHQIAASLVHAAAEEHGGRGLRRNRVAIVLFGTGFAVLAVSLLRTVLAARAAGSLAAAASAAVDVLSRPAPRFVLAPFRLLLAPTLAHSPGEWLPAALGVAALLALHYIWVQRTDAAFEETAAAEGARHAEELAAIRAGGFTRLRFSHVQRQHRLARPWLELRPHGSAAYAIFWKNVLYVQRLLRPSIAIFAGAGLALLLVLSLTTARSTESALRVLAIILFGLTVISTLTGALMFRNDLRMDLPLADQLRTYPLRGRDVVAAGIAASALCMTATQLVLFVPAVLIAWVAGMLGPLLALLAGASALVVFPVLNAMAALIQNAIALLFPAWTRLGEAGSGGMESLGQNVINLIGTALILAVVALPPLLLGAIVAAPLALWLDTAAAAAPSAIVVVAAVAVEVILLTRWLGRLYDSLDPVEAELLR